MPARVDMLLRTLGAEDCNRNRSSLRDVVTLDTAGDIVTQSDSLGALRKAPFRTLFYHGEATTPLPQEISGARTVGQQRGSAGHEYQARLVKACRCGFWSDADDIAQRAGNLRARKERHQRRNDHAVN